MVPFPYRGKVLYFLIPKKDRGWRSILDLRQLNKSVKPQKFRMTIFTTIIPALEEGDWFSSLDLQDVNFHIAIHPSHTGNT